MVGENKITTWRQSVEKHDTGYTEAVAGQGLVDTNQSTF